MFSFLSFSGIVICVLLLLLLLVVVVVVTISFSSGFDSCSPLGILDIGQKLVSKIV